MSASRFHKRDDYLRLKSATRRLVRACGTEDEAATVTRVSRGKIGQYGNINNTDVSASFMPIDVVLDLEGSVGEPILTRELARMQGHVLIELPRVMVESEWYRSVGGLAAEAGEVVSRICRALADDGDVSAEEIRTLKIREEIALAMERLMQLDHACGAVIDATDREGRA